MGQRTKSDRGFDLQRIAPGLDLLAVVHAVTVRVRQGWISAMDHTLLVVGQSVAVGVGQVWIEDRADGLVGIHQHGQRVVAAAGVSAPAGKRVAGVGGGGKGGGGIAEVASHTPHVAVGNNR